MLHCAPLAGQLMLCPCVNGAPHFQHGCMSCVYCCRCVLVCSRAWVRFVCCDVRFTCFQLGGFARRISFWFSWPLSRERAKFNTWAGVRTSESGSIWMAELFIFAMKKSLIRSSSTFPRAAFHPSSRNLLKKVSKFSLEIGILLYCSQLKTIERYVSWSRECYP